LAPGSAVVLSTALATTRIGAAGTVVVFEHVGSVDSAAQLLPATTTVFSRGVVPAGNVEASVTENVYVFVTPAAIAWPLQVRTPPL
jgi:hypothetical protein